MLLIDGVRYEEWIPQGPRAEDDFEELVKKHAQDIFGEESIYFDLKKKLITKAGIGSIPDGYVISFREPPCWYICEVELYTHPLYEHIVPQITKFINGVKSFETQREIINALDREISGDPFKEALVINKTGSREVYRFISNLISKPPVLAILIDQRTKELEEVCDSLPIDVKIVEFKTFVREGIGLAVHAHLFEPLYKPVIPIKPQLPAQRAFENSFRVDVYKSYIQYGYIGVWTKRRHLFPNFKTTLELNTDTLGIINVRLYVDPSRVELWNLDQWFKTHPELKPGAKLRITVIEPMKKYRLEIVKQEKEGGWRPIRLSP